MRSRPVPSLIRLVQSMSRGRPVNGSLADPVEWSELTTIGDADPSVELLRSGAGRVDRQRHAQVLWRSLDGRSGRSFHAVIAASIRRRHPRGESVRTSRLVLPIDVTLVGLDQRVARRDWIEAGQAWKWSLCRDSRRCYGGGSRRTFVEETFIVRPNRAIRCSSYNRHKPINTSSPLAWPIRPVVEDAHG